MSQVLITNSIDAKPALSIHAHDLGAAIQRELAALSAIGARYEAACDLLDRWPASPVLRDRRAHQLEERHRKEREPHVLRLAELHQQMVFATMFSDAQTAH